MAGKKTKVSTSVSGSVRDKPARAAEEKPPPAVASWRAVEPPRKARRRANGQRALRSNLLR